MERRTTIQTTPSVYELYPQLSAWILSELAPPPFCEYLKSNRTLKFETGYRNYRQMQDLESTGADNTIYTRLYGWLSRAIPMEILGKHESTADLPEKRREDGRFTPASPDCCRDRRISLIHVVANGTNMGER